jgi:hypothetical protein
MLPAKFQTVNLAPGILRMAHEGLLCCWFQFESSMRKVAVFCLLLFLAHAVRAELEVIPLRHRNAEEVLPIIRPLLDQDGVASGMNYQLILRTSPRNLAEIKELLESVDIKPRRLRITVMQDVDGETARRCTGASGSTGAGRDARIGVRGCGSGGGLTVEAAHGRDAVRVQMNEERASQGDSKVQQILVMEGARALVNTGLSVPVMQRQVLRSLRGSRVEESTQYREVSSGFYVLPRVSGERVTLEIRMQDEAAAPAPGNPPAIYTHQMATTVSGRLGEWLELGDASQQGGAEFSGLAARDSSNRHERRSVLLKVEEAGY